MPSRLELNGERRGLGVAVVHRDRGRGLDGDAERGFQGELLLQLGDAGQDAGPVRGLWGGLDVRPVGIHGVGVLTEPLVAARDVEEGLGGGAPGLGLLEGGQRLAVAPGAYRAAPRSKSVRACSTASGAAETSRPASSTASISAAEVRPLTSGRARL